MADGRSQDASAKTEAHRRRLIWEIGVVLASASYMVVFAWPASVQPGAWVWGSHGDGLGNIVEFSWFLQAIHQGLNWAVDPNLGIPFGERLGAQPHEPLYFWAQIGIGLVAGPVVALNMLSLLAIPAAAWAMFRLVLWITGAPIAGFVGGIGFGCCSYIIANTGGEPTLAQIWIFPVVALAILKVLHRPSVKGVIFAALALTLATLVNFYYVLFIALAAVVLVLAWTVYTVFERRALPVRPVLASAAGGALGVIATIAIYEVAVGNLAEKAGRIHRTPTVLTSLAASPIDVLLPPTTNPWFGSWRRQLFELRLSAHPGIYTDFSELSIAAPIILLAVVGLAVLFLPRFQGARSILVGRAEVVAMIGVALLGAWLLVPPAGKRFGLYPLSLQWDIWSIAPQYGSFYRAGLLIVLGACVLAGVGMAAIANRSSRVATVIALLAVAGIFIENFTVAADRVLAVTPLPEYTWVNQHPGSYALADYPVLPAGSGANEYTAEFYQRFHGHPLLNGGIGATESESMREELRDPNRQGVAAILAALGVRYLIWHTDVIRQFAPLNPPYAALLPSYKPHTADYRLEATFNDGASVFIVTAQPVSVFAFYAQGFGPGAVDGESWTRKSESADARIDWFVGPSGPPAVTFTFGCESGTTGAAVELGGRSWDLTPGQAAEVAFSEAARPGLSGIHMHLAPESAAENGDISCTPIMAVG